MSTSAVQPQAVRAPGEDGPRGSRGFRPLSLSLSSPDTAWGCGGSQPNPEALQPTASLRLSQASSKDTGQLYAALHHRILALRSRVEQEQEAKMPAPEPGAAPSNEDDSDEDVLAPSGATGGGELVVPALEFVGGPGQGEWGSVQGGDLTVRPLLPNRSWR